MSKQIIITGKPSIGKTTLIMELISLMKREKIPVIGFWTKEIRKKGKRVGFEFETTWGDVGTLAHVNSDSEYHVSKYGVNIDEFERKILPMFKKISHNTTQVIVMDELGKMEFLSSDFSKQINYLFSRSQNESDIVATLGLHYMDRYKKWKSKNDTLQLFRLTRDNYDKIKEIIISSITRSQE